MLSAITNVEAERMMKKIIDWYENQNKSEHFQLILLCKIYNLASHKWGQAIRQKKMTAYFKK